MGLFENSEQGEKIIKRTANNKAVISKGALVYLTKAVKGNRQKLACVIFSGGELRLIDNKLVLMNKIDTITGSVVILPLQEIKLVKTKNEQLIVISLKQSPGELTFKVEDPVGWVKAIGEQLAQF